MPCTQLVQFCVEPVWRTHLSVIENLLPQFGVQEEYRNILRGLIILVVVAVDVLARGAHRRARRT